MLQRKYNHFSLWNQVVFHLTLAGFFVIIDCANLHAVKGTHEDRIDHTAKWGNSTDNVSYQ